MLSNGGEKDKMHHFCGDAQLCLLLKGQSSNRSWHFQKVTSWCQVLGVLKLISSQRYKVWSNALAFSAKMSLPTLNHLWVVFHSDLTFQGEVVALHHSSLFILLYLTSLPCTRMEQCCQCYTKTLCHPQLYLLLQLSLLVFLIIYSLAVSEWHEGTVLKVSSS